MTGNIRALLALLLVTVLAGAALRAETAPLPSVDPGTTAVFVVRHAEKGKDDLRDPGLTEQGRRRAAELARLLEHSGVTHLFASEYRRTRETLEPLAGSTGLEIAIRPAREIGAQVQALAGLPRGSVAVVAGHSNTVPALVRGLGGHVDAEGLIETRSGPGLPETEHDRLFVVILSPGDEGKALKTMELRYGP